MTLEDEYMDRLTVLQQYIDMKTNELDELFRHPLHQETRTVLASSLLCSLDTFSFEYECIFAKLSAELAYEWCGMSRDVAGLIGQYFHLSYRSGM